MTGGASSATGIAIFRRAPSATETKNATMAAAGTKLSAHVEARALGERLVGELLLVVRHDIAAPGAVPVRTHQNELADVSGAGFRIVDETPAMRVQP